MIKKANASKLIKIMKYSKKANTSKLLKIMKYSKKANVINLRRKANILK